MRGTRIIKRVLLAIISALAALMVVCNLLVIKNAEGRLFEEVDSVPDGDYTGLLLGTTPMTRISHRRNIFFENRIKATANLYHAGKIRKILISGDDKSSRSMCAWYVIKAMWRGGCPIGLIPAYAYEKTLPQMGFNEIPTEDYRPMIGDISVLFQNEKSHFGHIAAWNDKQWVSDFKQKSIYPGRKYRSVGCYRIYRATNGWHWKHVWTSPADWYSWIESLVKGYKKIKL